MYNVIIRMAVVAAMVVMAGCSSDDTSDVPFDATLEGQAHWAQTDQCSGLTTITDANGTATVLGEVTAVATHCPETEDSADLEDGTFTLTADNGDELVGTYNYPAIDTGDPITWTGGTGRFENASGSVTITYDVTPVLAEGLPDFSVPWDWTATLTGTISY